MMIWFLNETFDLMSVPTNERMRPTGCPNVLLRIRFLFLALCNKLELHVDAKHLTDRRSRNWSPVQERSTTNHIRTTHMEFGFLCVRSHSYLNTAPASVYCRRGFPCNNIQFYMQRTDLKTPQSSSAANSVEAGGE